MTNVRIDDYVADGCDLTIIYFHSENIQKPTWGIMNERARAMHFPIDKRF